MSNVSTTTSSSTAASTGYSALKASDSGTGLDYSALIEAAVAARLTRADRIDSKITANQAKISAYGTMQTLLQAVNSSIDGLRNRTVSTGASTNLFSQRTAYLAGGRSVSASDVLAANVAEGTATGTYSVEVKQLATRNKIGSAKQSSQTDALGLSGTITLGVEGGTGVSIDIAADASLTDISDAINAQKVTSGVSAGIVKVSDTQYQLVLTATDTGKAITVADSGGNVLSGLGVTDSSGAVANTLVEAQDAILDIDGVTVTRSSNTISDAISGVTLDLYSADVGYPISVEVSTDLSSIKSALTTFVSAYNAFRDFATQQQATNSDGTKSDGATLFADSLLRQVNQSVYTVLNGKVATSGGSLSLSDLGITVDSGNTLTLDETTLNSALTNRLDDVRTLLGLTMTASSSDLQLLRYNNSLTRTAFTLGVQVGTDGTLTGASVDGDSTIFDVKDTRIIGKDGTPYAGLVFVYTGKSGSIGVNFSEGLADTLYTSIDGAANSTSGDIKALVDQLKSTDDDLQTRSDTIKTNAEDYRSRLTQHYARLEQKAEQANALLKQLTYSDSSSSG